MKHPSTRRVLVFGTGTGIGKTFATAAIARALRGRGQAVRALKPVESGTDPDPTDALELAEAAGHVLVPPAYALKAPLSPHLAARQERKTIRAYTVRAWVHQHSSALTLVETAGGLMSPLAKGFNNLDLVRLLDPHAVLVVALDRLGVLHELACCLEVIRTRAPHVPVDLLLNAPTQADASTGTNANEIRFLGYPIRAITTLPRGVVSPDTNEALADFASRWLQ